MDYHCRDSELQCCAFGQAIRLSLHPPSDKRYTQKHCKFHIRSDGPHEYARPRSDADRRTPMLPARKSMEAEIERFMYLTPDCDENYGGFRR